ncbi:hypothetical protein GGI20_000743 [Coemansia sp. BCRC 34301]|nr:hypothetical protein GGI20_000743 [Coemansia sp. BCRC 34301]
MNTPNPATAGSSPSSMGHTLYSPASPIDSSVSASDAEDSRSVSARLTAGLRKGNNDTAGSRTNDYSEYPPQTWTPEELLEMRARERTFDGAYWRTSVGLFGAALVILRVFGIAFFPVGMVFLALGVGFLAIGLTRRRNLIARDTHAHAPLFVTSGGTVLLSGAMCLAAYTVLLVLLWRM